MKKPEIPLGKCRNLFKSLLQSIQKKSKNSTVARCAAWPVLWLSLFIREKFNEMKDNTRWVAQGLWIPWWKGLPKGGVVRVV